jgi:hypothetical protein
LRKVARKIKPFGHPKIKKDYGEYFPKKEIWMVFDQSNGHKGSNRYVWYFDTEEEAWEWIKFHVKDNRHYDVSYPTKWKMVTDVPKDKDH